MEQILSQLPVAALVLFIMALWKGFEFFFKEKWTSSKETTTKHDFLIQQNTIALVELRVELKNLKELFLSINAKQTKMEGDLNALHKARREASPKG